MTITPISVFSDYPVQFEKPEGCLDRLCSRGRNAASVGGRSHGWWWRYYDWKGPCNGGGMFLKVRLQANLNLDGNLGLAAGVLRRPP